MTAAATHHAPGQGLARAFARAVRGLLLLGLAVLPGLARAEPVDHYVLALSWSPTYCEDHSARDEPLQCSLDADRTFIVHGLWPNTAHAAPSNCRSNVRGPSRGDIAKMLDIMPSEGLIRYQWRKHGTCSDLSAAEYFRTVRAAAAAVTIPPGLATIRKTIRVRPDILRKAFIEANPGLPADGIYVACHGDELVDVRICLTTDLAFRACPDVSRQRCRTRILEIDPPR